MAYKGYHFFIGELELPYAPSELKITIGSNNKTVNLINGNDINILKSPKLTEIDFEIELPRGRQYPFANTLVAPKVFTDYFEILKLDKTPVKLVITRPNPTNAVVQGALRGLNLIGGSPLDFESNDLTVTLEDYTLKESAENAYDIRVALHFKEYISYGTVKKINKNPVEEKPKPVAKSKQYVVKKGDYLWTISKRFYGTGSKWKIIYLANKSIIEKTAKKYGKKSSSNGWWIYPGTSLRIPNAKNN